MPAPLAELLPDLLAATEPYLERGFLAVYLHGSYVTGDADDWSDLDLCAVYTEGALPARREWTELLWERFGRRIDPLAAPLEQLGPGGFWGLGFVRSGLLAASELLLGLDVRSHVAPPPPALVRLGAGETALNLLRRRLALPAEVPLPASVGELPPSAWELATAYDVVHTTVQLLRGLVEIRSGVFLGSRTRVLEMAACESPRLAACAERAAQVRRRLPREAPPDAAVPALAELRYELPHLGQALLERWQATGLPDPSYEGAAGPAYAPDGTVARAAG